MARHPLKQSSLISAHLQYNHHQYFNPKALQNPELLSMTFKFFFFPIKFMYVCMYLFIYFWLCWVFVAAQPQGARGSWCGNLGPSAEARMVAGQASPIPLEHLFLFLVVWASAACERDQASEACSSLKLTA